MGIFDRFRSAGAAADGAKNRADTAEQDALRLIGEGNALEAEHRLEEAMQRYLKAIRLAPTLARAHFHRGNILMAMGDWKGALDAFAVAVRHNPDYAGVYFNTGSALLRYGQAEGAAASFRRALEINPDFVEAHNNLGNALQDLGQYEDAVASYRRALGLYPAYAEAHCNMGLALQALGQLDGAVASYLRALEIRPDLAEAHNNLGNALRSLGQLENALACYRRAVELRTDFAEAHNNLGFALQNLGQLDSAVASYRRALELNPDYAEAHCNLGNAQQQLGQLDSAVASYSRALEINPNFAGAHSNLGVAQKALGRLEDAVSSFNWALELNPGYAEAHNNLGLVLQDLGQLAEAEASYRRALEVKPDYPEAHSNLLFALNYSAAHPPSSCLEEARRYGRTVAAKVGRRFTAWQCAPRPARLRVGLVSGDLRNHVVGYFLEGLLANIDPARVELIAYPTHHREDEFTARIRPRFSAWKPLTGKSDGAAAELIHADGVHVLLDLSGHTAHNRLPVFAWKPAPVQAGWLGYFATTGLAEMDYLLADEVGVPEAQRQYFTESIWYLPETRLCFTAPAVDLPVAPLPALSGGRITFGCFQNLAKAGDAVLAAWGEIFAALPDARLRIQCKQLGEPAQRERLAERLKRHGIAPSRVTMHGPVDREGYLAAHAEVDMILDTFPYPGGTTTCEALWMGVPTVTLAGDSLLARQGASILTAAGLKEWIASSEDEYMAKAIAFAGDKSGLAAMRAGLRAQVLASPLFDARLFARNFEDALWGMWQSYQAEQEKPA